MIFSSTHFQKTHVFYPVKRAVRGLSKAGKNICPLRRHILIARFARKYELNLFMVFKWKTKFNLFKALSALRNTFSSWDSCFALQNIFEMLTTSVENMLVTSIDTTLETGVVPAHYIVIISKLKAIY